MTVKPTPTPWFIDPAYPMSIMAADEHYVPGEVAPWHVANLMEDCGGHESGEPDANAALILRAVNNHCELIAALEEALNQLETNYMQAVSKGHHWPNERVNMTSAAKLKGRNALAQAKA